MISFRCKPKAESASNSGERLSGSGGRPKDTYGPNLPDLTTTGSPVSGSSPKYLSVGASRNSMAFSRESRIPFLDYRIVDYVISLPKNYKITAYDRKKALKNIMHSKLSSKIINRKDKMGFPVPLNQWIKKDLRQFTLELLTDNKAKTRKIINSAKIEKYIDNIDTFSRELWGALNIEMWFKVYIDE